MKYFFCSMLVVLCMTVALAQESISVKIKGMHCGGCEDTITEKIKGSDKFDVTRVDHKTGKATVQLKTGVTLSQSETEDEISKLLDGTDYHVVKSGKTPSSSSKASSKPQKSKH